MNYFNTFIAVAPDTKATTAKVPVARGGAKSIAELEYEMLADKPYKYTQEDVQFGVHVRRQGIGAAALKKQRDELWQAFFAKSMACMRTSPLAKSHGWGLHFDRDGRLALVAMESAAYQRLGSDPSIQQTRAMRSKRA